MVSDICFKDVKCCKSFAIALDENNNIHLIVQTSGCAIATKQILEQNIQMNFELLMNNWDKIRNLARTEYTIKILDPIVGSSIKKITCGHDHVMALDCEDQLWAYGKNDKGQLGLSDYINRDKFFKVSTQHNFLNVFCGKDFSFAIDIYKNLWCCGDNTFGQLGLNNYKSYNKLKNNNKSDTIFDYMACGTSHTVALDEQGNIWSVGSNDYGQLGLGDTENRNIFVKIKSQNFFISILCHNLYTMALDSEGVLWSCGDDFSNQLGFAEFGHKNTLTRVRGNVKRLMNDDHVNINKIKSTNSQNSHIY